MNLDMRYAIHSDDLLLHDHQLLLDLPDGLQESKSFVDAPQAATLMVAANNGLHENVQALQHI